MSITRTGRFSTAARDENARHRSRFSVIFWFGLSLCFAVGYSIVALLPALNSEYIVGGEARKYLFWMYRFLGPQLFPHDLIADYFQSVTPTGYAALHHLMASFGVTPLVVSKFLPIILAIITTSYAFAVSLQILPIPIAGFISTLLLNQTLWMQELMSDTPRGFLCPLFFAFLYYLLKRSPLPCLIAIALQSLFFPLTALISSGILLLRLFDWQGRIRLSPRRDDFVFCILGICVALLAFLPYILASSASWATVAALDSGDNGISAWQCPPQLSIGLLLPIALRFPASFPLARQVKNTVQILCQIVLASLFMFFAAQEMFELNFPSAYTFHFLQIVLALASGITLTLILDAVFNWSERRSKPYLRARQFFALFSAVVVVVALIFYPYSSPVFPKTQYVEGKVGKLYQFLQQQPKASLIASLTDETDNLPIFAKRSILAGKAYALPPGTKYYVQSHERVSDLINAQYTLDPKQIKNIIYKYGISFWLLERDAFKPKYINDSTWIKQYQPAANKALANLQSKAKPALMKLMKLCKVYDAKGLVLLSAKCLEK